jgi:hypothetical protein
MSLYRQQALIEAPVTTLWELIGDVNRHPEWWPKVVEIECDDDFGQGCNYRMVTKGPFGTEGDMMVEVERLEGCRELLIRCMNTGTYCKWLLTEAQGGTFIDAEFGMDPRTAGTRVFDAIAGKRYFRRWLQQSLAALEETATRAPSAKAA